MNGWVMVHLPKLALLYHFIMIHLQENWVLTNKQHGFRAGYSCSTQLISLIEEISTNINAQQQVDLILWNFSKACEFDSAPHC